MQKPRFRTVEKSAWVFVTTKLHPTKTPKMDRRTALRSGYLAAAANQLGTQEGSLPTPESGEPMRRYLERAKSTRSGG